MEDETESTIFNMLYEAYDAVGYGSTGDEMPDCYLVAEELAAMVKNQSGRIGAGSGQSYKKIEHTLEKEANVPSPNSNPGRRPSFFRDWLERFRREFLGELRRLLVGGYLPSGRRMNRDHLNNGTAGNSRNQGGRALRDGGRNNKPATSGTEPPQPQRNGNNLACVACNGPTEGGKPCKSGVSHYCMSCRVRHPSIVVLREGVRGPCELCTRGEGDLSCMRVLMKMAMEGTLNL